MGPFRRQKGRFLAISAALAVCTIAGILSRRTDSFLVGPPPFSALPPAAPLHGRSANNSQPTTFSYFATCGLAGGASLAAMVMLKVAGTKQRTRKIHQKCTILKAEGSGKTRLEDLKAGDKCSGKVTRDASIGVWLDIGAEKDALLPRNQVPQGVKYSPGETIEDLTIFEVTTGATPAERKIRVSTGKMPTEFKEGDKIKGTVARVVDYGIFFNIGGIRDALGPSRMLSDSTKKSKTGDEVQLTVISVDGDKITVSDGSETAPAPATEAGGTKKIDSLQIGMEVEGTVVRVNSQFGVFFNIGAESDALCFTAQLDKPVDDYKQGDKVTGLTISNINKEKKQIEVTTRPLASTVKVGQKLEGSTVLRVTKGGVFFDAGLASDVLATPQMLSKNINDYTRGEVADLIVMRVQGEKVTVSTKSEEEIGTPLASLVRGTSVKGKVTSVDPAVGVFLDIGAAKDALWRMKGFGASLPPKPLEEYVAGEEVTGLIITRIDNAAQLLEVSDPLSLAQTPAEETGISISNLKVGTKVSGTVSRVMEFGVFVNIGAERDALYPVSQLEKPSNAYKVGDKLDDLRVSEVDPEKRRLGVSMKKNASDYTVGEEVTGKVSKVMPFGLFVDIGASVDVLAPASMLEKNLEEYSQGDELSDLKIASVDVEKNKMSVGQGSSQRGSAGRLSIDDLSVGQKIDGVVRMTREYGAFVDIGLGRRDALMPLAMMGDRSVDSFKPNDQIEVYVAQIDEANDRVTISFVEPTEEMKMKRGRVRGKDDGGEYGIPEGFCLPDPKRVVAETGREDTLDPEPISWREMEKKYPGLVSFPEKEYEVYISAAAYGFNCWREMTPASTAWIPIPLHLRKPDAGPPEIPLPDLQDFPNNPYETGISPEIHVKYRQPPLNDPNWTYRPGLSELKPMPEEVLRARIPEYVPERKPTPAEGEDAPKKKKGAKKFGCIRVDNFMAK
eukprot:TRINITY_DN34166_c0_g1_i1.p1 TRINITY_DN34166_c0_g1~~TRINITY_DN34166_c0_g1_i1.p1  ORF type:complete len:955 (-),score=175.92 TRINITY_DN34166_c0_g1_i1:52-2916(-)